MKKKSELQPEHSVRSLPLKRGAPPKRRLHQLTTKEMIQPFLEDPEAQKENNDQFRAKLIFLQEQKKPKVKESTNDKAR